MTALRDAARRRPLDFVARYGGEELVAVLYGADRAYGESIARNLLAAVRELRIPHDSSQTQPYVTVSVGVVAVDAYRVASHDAAVELADQALYEAKNQGRDRYVALDPAAARTDARRCRRAAPRSCASRSGASAVDGCRLASPFSGRSQPRCAPSRCARRGTSPRC